MKSEDFNDIPKNVIFRNNSEGGTILKKNSFLIESLLSSSNDHNQKVIESVEENKQVNNEMSDSNSCHSSSCSSRSISPGCENESLTNENEHRIPNYPFPHPMAIHPHYQNFELFYHPRNFYFENYEFSRKLKITELLKKY